MVRKGMFFVLIIIVGAALFISGHDQRQAVAKFLFYCLIIGLVIKPVGLSIGRTLQRMLKKD